ncbi:MAG TPA: protein phosphatase CheZ [Aliidongia sp.]|nr:protein phosphatase CheZ [Aliidongia sp.]
MSGLKVPKDLAGEQYIAIEDALLSSEAGRAFLRMRDKRAAVLAVDEYHAGLRSIRQWIEQSQVRSAEDVHLEVLRRELIEMAASIRKAKTEIWAMKPADDSGPGSTRRINLATEELDAIVHATERATSDILNGAERIMELAQRVKKAEGLGDEAEQLDIEATNILMACGFQDITGQRISKVVSTLRYLEERVDAMIRIWGIDGVRADEVPVGERDMRPDAHLMNGPSLSGGVDQSEVDNLLAGGFATPSVEDEWAAAAAEPAPPAAAAPAEKPKAAEKSPEKKAEKKAKEPVVEIVDSGAALDQSSIDSLFP